MKRQLGFVAVMAFIFSGNIFATPQNSDRILNGVVENINYSANTLVITNDETGRQEIYVFDKNTRVLALGKEVKLHQVLEPGVTVRLKLSNPKNELTQINSTLN